MKELLHQAASIRGTRHDKFVCVFISGKEFEYTGNWQWDLQSEAVFCSDVMFNFPILFEGTKGIIHPDDKALVLEQTAATVGMEIPFLQFRVITTYGEIKTLTGRNLQAVEVKVSVDPALDQQERLKTEIEASDQSQRLHWQRRAMELAERITAAGTWYLDSETHEMYYSDEVYRIHDLPRQGLNAHLNTFSSFIHPDDRETVSDTFTKALQEQLPLHLEYRIVSAAGQVKHLHQATHWEYNETGRLMLFGMLQDVSSQVALEQKDQAAQFDLQFKSKILQLNEQSAIIGHWTVNLLTRKVSYSDNLYRLYSLKSGTVAPSINLLLNSVHPEDRDVVHEVYKKILQQQVPPDIDYRIIRNDGKVRYMRQRGKLVIYGENEMLMIVALQDVTTEIITNHKLGDLKQRAVLQQLVQHQSEVLSGTATWYWDPQTEQVTCSEHLFELLGYKQSGNEFTQKHLLHTIHPEDRKKFTNAQNITVHEKVPNIFDVRIVCYGEVRQVRASFRVVDYLGKELFIGVLHDVNHVSELQHKLSFQLQQTDTVINNMLDRAFITNTENTILLWNRRCELAYGQKKDAVLGKNIFDVLPDLKNEKNVSFINRALIGETITLTQSKAANGKEFHDLHLIPMYDEAGTVTGILHLIHDVTQEHDMRLRLNERLNFIESLLEASVDRIIVMDRYMNYLYCNEKAAGYYNLRKEDIIGKNVLEIFPASVNDPSHEHFRKALKGEMVRIPVIDGIVNDHYYEVFLIPIKNDSDEVSAVLWMHHDLSGDIKAQRQLKKAKDLLDTIDEAYTELDNNGVFIYVNKRAEQIWQMEQADLLGKKIDVVLPDRISADGLAIIAQALEYKEPARGEIFSEAVNRWLHLSAIPTDEGAIVLFYDITEIKETRKNLET